MFMNILLQFFLPNPQFCGYSISNGLFFNISKQGFNFSFDLMNSNYTGVCYCGCWRKVGVFLYSLLDFIFSLAHFIKTTFMEDNMPFKEGLLHLNSML